MPKKFKSDAQRKAVMAKYNENYNPSHANSKNHLVYMGRHDTVELFFEGHTFQVEYDPETNENLKMKKVI